MSAHREILLSVDMRAMVPNAGLLPAAVLAQQLDLAALVDRRLHLARHGANGGAKALLVIGSMLAGGGSIDDVAVLRADAASSLSTALERRRRSGRGCGRTSGPTSVSSTRSAASSWPGCGPPALDRPI